VAIQSWEWGWQWRAACRGEDAALFFPPGHPEPKSERVVRERKAKAICAVCPVRMECLEYAIMIREPHGVWGGLNEGERRALLRQRDQDRSQPGDQALRIVD
jgi:WhiB family redox-sensing transcriptional regulator